MAEPDAADRNSPGRDSGGVLKRIEMSAWAVMAIAVVIYFMAWLVTGATSGPIGAAALVVAAISALAGGVLRSGLSK